MQNKNTGAKVDCPTDRSTGALRGQNGDRGDANGAPDTDAEQTGSEEVPRKQRDGTGKTGGNCAENLTHANLEARRDELIADGGVDARQRGRGEPMTRVSVRLPIELEEDVDHRVDRGPYATRSELLREAVRRQLAGQQRDRRDA